MELRQIGRLIYPPRPDLRYRLRFVKGRMIPPHVPHACRLQRPEHLGHLIPFVIKNLMNGERCFSGSAPKGAEPLGAAAT